MGEKGKGSTGTIPSGGTTTGGTTTESRVGPTVERPPRGSGTEEDPGGEKGNTPQ